MAVLPVALVTGAARGLGRAIAMTLGARGYAIATAQLPTYTGGIYGNAASAHDSRLRWAVGVQNVQVVRSAPDNPGQTDGDSTFYRHHVDVVYWNGRFWSMHYGSSKQLNWSTNGLDWNPSVSASSFMPGVPPRMCFYVASNGRLLGLGWDGVDHRGDRLAREILGSNSYGTVYSIKTNYLGRDPNNNWPSYTTSTSSGFRSACAELLNKKIPLTEIEYALGLVDIVKQVFQ